MSKSISPQNERVVDWLTAEKVPTVHFPLKVDCLVNTCCQGLANILVQNQEIVLLKVFDIKITVQMSFVTNVLIFMLIFSSNLALVIKNTTLLMSKFLLPIMPPV